MSLFRYASSIYGGGDTLIGANYGLLPWFAAAGVAIAIAHAIFKAVVAAEKAEAVLKFIRSQKHKAWLIGEVVKGRGEARVE